MKKLILISILLITLTACGNTTYKNMTETAPQILTTESNKTEVQSASTQTTTKTENLIKEIDVTKHSLSEISTEESDLFAKNFNNDEPIFDDHGGCYYKKLIGKNSFYPILYYDNGNGKSIKANLPESDYYFYDALFYNNALYGILNEDLTDDYFIVKYQNENTEKIMNDPIDHWYFSEDGIYYQIGNSIYLIDYNGMNSRLITTIPDELYIDSHNCEFVIYHGSIWYQHCSQYDKTETPLWKYDLETRVFTQINSNIIHANLEAVNNGYLYFSAQNGFWRLSTDKNYIEKICDQEVRSVNFFDDNIILITSKNEVNIINSNNTIKILDGNSKEFGYDEPYYDSITIFEDRIFLKIQYGEDHGKIVEIDLEGKFIKQIVDF